MSYRTASCYDITCLKTIGWNVEIDSLKNEYSPKYKEIEVVRVSVRGKASSSRASSYADLELTDAKNSMHYLLAGFCKH